MAAGTSIGCVRVTVLGRAWSPPPTPAPICCCRSTDEEIEARALKDLVDFTVLGRLRRRCEPTLLARRREVTEGFELEKNTGGSL